MEITLEELDTLSIENEKKNQRIRELEEAIAILIDRMEENDLGTSLSVLRARKLLNQKP